MHGGLVAMQYDEHGVAQQARMVQDDTILPYDILSDGSSVYVGAISARSASGSVVRMRDRRADSVYDGMPQWS